MENKKTKKDLIFAIVAVSIIISIPCAYITYLACQTDAPNTTVYLNEQAVFDNIGVYVKNIETPTDKKIIVTIHVTNYNKNKTKSISRSEFELNDTYTMLDVATANFYYGFDLLPQSEYDFSLVFYTTYEHGDRIYTLQWQPSIFENPINLVLAFKKGG